MRRPSRRMTGAPRTDEALYQAVARLPKQARSRASIERMLAAAEKLMRRRGTDTFTLAEICSLGRVSMGSIYFRFSSKDDIVRLLQKRVLADLETQTQSSIDGAVARAVDLKTLIGGLLQGVAEKMRDFGPILRPIMLRSVSDPTIRSRGKASYYRLAVLFERGILTRVAEITHPQPEQAAAAIYPIIYAALGRALGFNLSPGQTADVMEWDLLKRNLTVMCAGYLMCTPELARDLESREVGRPRTAAQQTRGLAAK